MKIALDVAQTCVERAGCGWVAYAVAQELVAAHPEHQYTLLHQFGDWINPSTAGGFMSEASHVTAPLREMSPDESRAVWARIKTGQAEVPGTPDVVHAFSFQAPRLPGTKLVMTVYDVSFWRHPEFTTEGNRLFCQRGVLDALANASGLHFISEFAHSEFELLTGGWLAESGLPYAVATLGSRFERAVAPREELGQYWLFVGSMEPRKNFTTLLDAYQQYRRMGGTAPLWVAGGSGWKSEGIKARLLDLESEGHVRMLGYVDDARLVELLRGARALILPSWYEGFGLPALEAMSQGCPVISSNAASLPEVVGDAGFLIDPTDVAGFVAAMLELESDSNRWQTMAQRGLDRAAGMTWRHTADKLLELYASLA